MSGSRQKKSLMVRCLIAALPLEVQHLRYKTDVEGERAALLLSEASLPLAVTQKTCEEDT